jgi:leader peptidase (prepilin peptidase)/N-methyltransferase
LNPTIDLLPTYVVIGFAVALGLLFGSFLNVVIYRVPRGMSVARPPSHCPNCKAPVKPWQNIPVLSYVFLRGKTACCGQKISARYPAVELIGGVLSVAIVEILILKAPTPLTLGRAGAIYASSLALALGLVAAAFIDMEHMLIPLSISIGGTVLGVATSSLRELAFTDSLIGAAIGFFVVWFPFDFLYSKLRGKTGMAMGDAFLVMLAGAWFGWRGALFALSAGALQGTLFAILTMLFGGKIEEPDAVKKEREEILAEIEALPEDEREAAMKEWKEADPLATEADEGTLQARIAFGPFLCLAILEYLYFGQALMDYVTYRGAS